MRRYGSGSVFPSKGKWLAQWELPREDGKRRRRQLTADSEAEGWRRMRAAQRTEGQSSSRSRQRTESVGAFLDRWLADVAPQKRRERTVVGYRAILAVVPATVRDAGIGDGALPHLLQVWIGSLDRHPRTIAHYAAVLRTAFGYAVRKHMIAINPAADLDLPAIPRTDRIPLTADELRAFLGAVEGPLAPLWITAGWTGLRQGELLGLRWEDVSLDRATLIVRHSMSRLPGKKGTRYVLTDPKTERSRRTVPLLPAVVEALRPLRKAYLRQPPELDQGLVFATPSGSPLDASRVSLEFGRALAATGTRHVRFHDLRHGTASLLIEKGVDLATVSAILGHSNIGTTVDLYGHLTETHKRTAMAKLEDVG